MSDIIKALANMPIHYILVLIGIAILIAAIAGEYKDQFRLSHGWQRIAIASLGLLLILYFLLIESDPIGKVAKPAPTISKDTNETTISKPSSPTEVNQSSNPKYGENSKTVDPPSTPSMSETTITSTVKSYSVSGIIKDKDSERGLEDVEVRIGNQAIKTDKGGFFSLKVQGYYGERKRIYMQKEGYEDRNVRTNIPSENFSDYLTKIGHENSHN